MELKDISKQYNVSLDLLYQMINVGVLDDLQDDVIEGNYGEKSIKRLSSCICLSSLGLDVNTVKQFIFLEVSKKDTRMERIKILRNHRDKNLDNVHQAKRTMDCIDSVIKELKSK